MKQNIDPEAIKEAEKLLDSISESSIWDRADAVTASNAALAHGILKAELEGEYPPAVREALKNRR